MCGAYVFVWCPLKIRPSDERQGKSGIAFRWKKMHHRLNNHDRLAWLLNSSFMFLCCISLWPGPSWPSGRSLCSGDRWRNGLEADSADLFRRRCKNGFDADRRMIWSLAASVHFSGYIVTLAENNYDNPCTKKTSRNYTLYISELVCVSVRRSRPTKTNALEQLPLTREHSCSC